MARSALETKKQQDIFFILSIPLIFTILTPNWLFNSIGYLDAWFYVGYFLHYLSHHPVYDDYYKISRLPWIYIGFFFFHLFPPFLAGILTHLSVFSASIAIFHSSVKMLFGRTSAFILGALLCFYFPFYGSGGWDYHTTAVCSFYFAAVGSLLVWKKTEHTCWIFITGLFLTAGVLTNLFSITLLPGFFIALWMVRPLGSRREFLKVFGLLIVSALVEVVLLGALNRSTHGKFFFFMPQVRYTLWLSKGNEWFKPVKEWLPSAYHVVWPIGILVLSSIDLYKTLKAKRNPLFRIVVGLHINYLLDFFLFLIWQFKGQTILQSDYQTIALVPPAFLSLSACLRGRFETLKLDSLKTKLLPLTIFIWPFLIIYFGWAEKYTGEAAANPVLIPVLFLATGFGLVYSQKRKTTIVYLGLLAISLSLWSLNFGTVAQIFSPCSYSKDGFLSIIEVEEQITKQDPKFTAKYWYDPTEAVPSQNSKCGPVLLGNVFHSASAVRGWLGALISYPLRTNSPIIVPNDLKSSRETVKLIILEANDNSYKTILRNLTSMGRTTRLLSEVPISHGQVNFKLRIVEISLPPPSNNSAQL